MKKYHLKKKVEEVLTLGTLSIIAILFMILYVNRTESIGKNPNGYTESGHAHSVEVNFIR